MKRVAYFFIFSLTLASCQPDKACRQDTTITAEITLRGVHLDANAVGTYFTSWDSITVQGVGSDSILYTNSKGVSRIHIPLRIDTTITAFQMTWHGETETIYIRHNNNQRFISMACGCVVFHTIDSVWHDGVWVDSLKIVNSSVETVTQDNIRLFVTTKSSFTP